MRRLGITVLAGLVFGAAAGSLGAAAAEPQTVRLSDEKLLTRWAHPNARAPIRTKPSGSARIVTRLRYRTEDHRPNVYVALSLRTNADGSQWTRIRVPMRPNGRTGWVRRSALGVFHNVRTRLVINRHRFRASLYRKGRRIWTSRIGVGKRGSPTPAGRFYVREKLADYASPFYGPLALGTSAYSSLSDWPKGGVVGIHGTSQPELIPGRVSHGCVRVPNRKIVRLAALTPIGTPILIK